MQLPTTIALAALGLVFITGEAGAYYHNADREAREQRERNEWVDRERARQEIQEFNREQERIMHDAQSGSRFLDSLRKQGGLYEPTESLFDPPSRRRY